MAESPFQAVTDYIPSKDELLAAILAAGDSLGGGMISPALAEGAAAARQSSPNAAALGDLIGILGPLGLGAAGGAAAGLGRAGASAVARKQGLKQLQGTIDEARAGLPFVSAADTIVYPSARNANYASAMLDEALQLSRNLSRPLPGAEAGMPLKAMAGGAAAGAAGLGGAEVAESYGQDDLADILRAAGTVGLGVAGAGAGYGVTRGPAARTLNEVPGMQVKPQQRAAVHALRRQREDVYDAMKGASAAPKAEAAKVTPKADKPLPPPDVQTPAQRKQALEAARSARSNYSGAFQGALQDQQARAIATTIIESGRHTSRGGRIQLRKELSEMGYPMSNARVAQFINTVEKDVRKAQRSARESDITKALDELSAPRELSLEDRISQAIGEIGGRRRAPGERQAEIKRLRDALLERFPDMTPAEATRRANARLRNK